MLVVDPTFGVVALTIGSPPRLLHIDPDLGTVTTVATLDDGLPGPQGVYTLDPTRHLLYFLRDYGPGADHLAALDVGTGAVVLDTPMPDPGLIFLQYDPAADLLFGVTLCCPNVFVAVDPASGAPTPLTLIGDATVGFPQGIDAVDPGDHLYIFERDDAGSMNLVTVDTRTGSQRSAAQLAGYGLIVVEYLGQ
jgi:hypothetical protein